jgi:hypothetical protein
MEKTFLLTVKIVGQTGNDVLISPSLPADKYHFIDDTEKVQIVTPDNRSIEKDAEFGFAFDVPNAYIPLILNTKKDETPIGSQIWVMISLDQITHKECL